MVKGETYYSKFQTNPSISLSGYQGTFTVTDKSNNIVLNGDMTKSGSYFEILFDTKDLISGTYRLICLVEFPDGFKQAINDEQIQIG